MASTWPPFMPIATSKPGVEVLKFRSSSNYIEQQGNVMKNSFFAIKTDYFIVLTVTSCSFSKLTISWVTPAFNSAVSTVSTACRKIDEYKYPYVHITEQKRY
jgi:hypothetical protein